MPHIAKADPQLSIDLSGVSKTFGDTPFSVVTNVSSLSGGTLHFSTGSGSVGCTVTDGGSVTITGAAVGTDFCVISVSQDSTANYTSGGPTNDQFHIAKADPQLWIDLSGVSKTFGDTPFSVVTNVSSLSGGTLHFSTGSGSVGCTVTDGGSVTITGAAVGTDFCVISVSQDSTANYTSGGPTNDQFHIAKADPQLSIDLSGVSKTFGDTPFSVVTNVFETPDRSMRQLRISLGDVELVAPLV